MVPMDMGIVGRNDGNMELIPLAYQGHTSIQGTPVSAFCEASRLRNSVPVKRGALLRR